MNYNAYSYETAKKYYNLGVKFEQQGKELKNEWKFVFDGFEYVIDNIKAAFFFAGFDNSYNNCDGRKQFLFDFAPRIFYRIGEPKLDVEEMEYFRSWNYADNKFERGLSVINYEWLNSVKSIFFVGNRKTPIYKIYGIQVGWGSDGEPLVYPLNFAEKTNLSLDDVKNILS